MADLNAFINKYNGKLVPSCGGYSNQCVSLAQAWASENGVGGCPIFPVGAAKDMVGTRGDVFDWIANTPTGVPQAGDIIVWNNAVGNYGHTAVFVDGNANSFRSFDINWPTGSLAHIQNHNYNGVVGWLRRKQAPATPPKGDNGVGVPNAQYDAVVVDNYNLNLRIRELEKLLADSGGNTTALNNQIKQQNDRINELQKALESATGLVTKLQAELEATGNDKKSLTKKVEDLEKTVENLANSTPTTLDSYNVGELIGAVIKRLFKKSA